MKPYLIRAVREWAIDNGFTPQLLVDASKPSVNVPAQYVDEDRIVLNIHDQAVQGLEMSNEWILFNARFSGTVHQIDIPIEAVVGIFSRETQQGLAFTLDEIEQEQEIDSDDALQVDAEARQGKPNLRIVR